MAFKNGDLYVSSVSSIYKITDVMKAVNQNKKPSLEVFYDGLPKVKNYQEFENHAWKYIKFGPDGHLYIISSSNCNACEPKHQNEGVLGRIHLDTKKMEVLARGIRSSSGFALNKSNDHIYFTDNGRERYKPGQIPDEINLLRPNQSTPHFGFPHCYGKSTIDKNFKKHKNCKPFHAPIFELPPHSAPLGLVLYSGNLLPRKNKQNLLLFLAEHGTRALNMKHKINGYQIRRIELLPDGTTVLSSTPLVTNFIQKAPTINTQGRPVDIIEMDDGSLIFSDDYKGAIYRITYNGTEI